MKTASTNYLDTLDKIELLKINIQDIEKNIYSQIPQEITNKFDNSKSLFLNWIEEIEIALLDYNLDK
ncbi:MAG: hypothetical protein QX189_19820 [Methylococcales bacterium]